ncbi:MAG: glycosyltransferase family 2 protein [Candidatus Levybacteria bacterium]|nr:glycosyltransferase family 2 protein [Candidatus Levybacteria bacterium]
MLSVVILTKNEEKNIFDCLETVLWADEIVIVDDFSTDRTLEVIKSLENKKIKIYKNSLNGDFSKQRTFGLSKTTKKWVLFIDADERITSQLREEINTMIINSKESNTQGYYIQRKDVLWGKTLNKGETGNIKFLRLAKRDSGIWFGKIHETWQINGKTDEFENYLIHFPHPTVDEFLEEINFYSTIRAKDLYGQKIRSSFISILNYPLGKFVLNFMLKRGFQDGLEGLVFAIMMSFHSFLVRSKLWLLWQKKSLS